MKAAVVGAGAAGLMAAGASGIKATVFERNEKAGKKLYISGKGRCNFTNASDIQEFSKNIVSGAKFCLGALNAFTPSDAIELVNSFGVKTKTERGGRVFPESDKASDIIKALKSYAGAGGADIRYNSCVLSAKKESGAFLLKIFDAGKNETYEEKFDKLVIATGGKSYPQTGSDGGFYKIIESFSHKIIEPRPALVPVLLKEDVKDLEGLSLKNVTAAIEGKGIAKKEFGEMLFTSNGVSGPIILTLSSYINRLDLSRGAYKLIIDLKPALSFEQLDKRVLRDFEKNKNKMLKNSLDELLPKSLIPFIIAYTDSPGDRSVNSVTKTERERFINALKRLEFTVSALDGLERAIITAGGVDLKEVSPKTMESKIVEGLYFAGEALDIDALTGGFNIQLALSTGYLAGKNL